MIHSYSGSQKDALLLTFILINSSTCLGQTYCPASGVLILHSQQLVFVMLVMLALCSVSVTNMTYTSYCEDS